MDPFSLRQVSTNVTQPDNSNKPALLQTAYVYPARLVTSSNTSPTLVLQSPQGPLRLPLHTLPAGLPANVPLQLSFSATASSPNVMPATPAPTQLSVNVMQWHGSAQAVPLTAAQTQYLKTPANIQQFAQHIAQGEAIRHLAGEPIKLPAQLFQGNAAPLNQTAALPATVQLTLALLPTATAQAGNVLAATQFGATQLASAAQLLINTLQTSEVFQTLSRTQQQQLLQPAQQIAVLQQILSKAPIIQLAADALSFSPAQRQALSAMLLPLVNHYAMQTIANTHAGAAPSQNTPALATMTALLLMQPLRALPTIQLSHHDIARPWLLQGASLLNIDTQAGDTPGGRTQGENPAAQADNAKSVNVLSRFFKDTLSQLSQLKEDMMKGVNLEKVFQATGASLDRTSPSLQAGLAYFGKLERLTDASLTNGNPQQRLTQAAAQFVLHTAQGVLKLPLLHLPALPVGVPLQLRFDETAGGGVEINIKILATLPQTVNLTAAQAQLLQDPKYLALLQQRLAKGEPINQLAGEPLKITPQQGALQLSLHQALTPPGKGLAGSTTQVSASNLSTASSAGNTSGQWQLQIQAIAGEQKLQLASSDFIKPLLLLAATPTATTAQASAVSSDIRSDAWRQLYPLLESTPASLRQLPEMPVAVQQFLSQLRQAQPDGAKVLSSAQIIEQLQATLQFQPLQTQPNMATSAGTLAVAIQLLLGHLLRQPVATSKEPAAQRLAQSIGQLDAQQSSQLLRALGSHSSALQLAQLQTADTATIGQQWLIPLALQQQQESRLSQIVIEQREHEHADNAAKQKYWQLTMKFDLGSYGQLMAVAKLRDTELQLQFYTDDALALRQAEKFLPLLSDRCTAQGLTVSKAQCQLGKIPDTLGQRRTSLISTKA
ncbi:flagellar hook-length control protein FliK [Alishewanella tabrizica]|uniref:Flagellar hook-length control protein-like C-terminal domain-containing protein n=1 Tax=Alishewanella tabrizica TaxID=671278 RepID=A0ABQ2WCN1_9ALTE|nr:flagellar hook-length control protein FliK [Alishewanella tabrizica]GGW48776.1 hypothetical protein GCM10008111_00580 [Alishewanella tabrizica]